MRARKPIELSDTPGPDMLHGVWPWEENLHGLRRLGIQAEFSNDAGAYVCECAYWSALNFRRLYGYPLCVSFFHVPVINEQWNEGLLSDAVLLSLDTAIQTLQGEIEP